MGLVTFYLFIHFPRRPLAALEASTAPTGALEATALRPVRASLPLSVSARLLPAFHKARPTPGLEQAAGVVMTSEITPKLPVSVLLQRL
jgi:hypothetical protein